METNKNILLLYNNKEIEINLPSTYDEFLELLVEKLYLTPEIIKCAVISYKDLDGDNNIISSDSYEDCLKDNEGVFEMEIDNSSQQINNEDDFANKINDKKNDKQFIKDMEQKIINKYIKIFKDKLKNKKIEHQNEISSLKKDFENTMKSVIEVNEDQYKNIAEYYNQKMKDNFKKYNDMIIANIDKGLSQSDLNIMAEQFINNNYLNEDNNNIKENNENLSFSLFNE